ncbi:MAG: ABC transporter ATP-binding protein [Planctomycetota bacterium]
MTDNNQQHEEWKLDDDTYQGRFNPKLWLSLYRHALPYRWYIAGLGLAGLTMAAAETTMPIITASMIDRAIAGAPFRELLPLILAYSGLFIVVAAIVYAFIVLAGKVATGLDRDLRSKGFRHLQGLSFSYFDTRPVGWLVTRLTSDTNKISEQVPWLFLDLVWGPTFILAISTAMFILSPSLALWVLATVPVLIVITLYFQQKLLRTQREVRRVNSQLTASYSESLMGVRTTKTLTRERKNLIEFSAISKRMRAHSLHNALLSAVYLPMVTLMGGVGAGLALWQGSKLLGVPDSAGVLGSGLTPGQLIAFMQFAGMLFMPIQDLAMHFTRLQSAQASAERLQSLLDTEPDVGETQNALDAITTQESRIAVGEASTEEPIDGGDALIQRMTFENVSFWYVEGEPVLRGIDLEVQAGQTVAFVGPTGGGKSTTVSLAARFYEPTNGRITINGMDYRDRSLAWLQSQLGVVLQTPHLFNDTVRENIRYGRLNASEHEIVQAAKLVGAHNFIVQLEGGYDANVGESGGSLSTGQRQLIALARAVLVDPQIVIMDEATSSVDTEAERLIQQAMDQVLHGRIAFVIAHRLSTIRNADFICVIQRGEIVERGTHDELLAKQGAYADLYQKQFAQESEHTIIQG